MAGEIFALAGKGVLVGLSFTSSICIGHQWDLAGKRGTAKTYAPDKPPSTDLSDVLVRHKPLLQQLP